MSEHDTDRLRREAAALDESIRREVDGDGGLGELLEERRRAQLDPNIVDAWAADDHPDPTRAYVDPPVSPFAQRDPAPRVAVTLPVSEEILADAGPFLEHWNVTAGHAARHLFDGRCPTPDADGRCPYAPTPRTPIEAAWDRLVADARDLRDEVAARLEAVADSILNLLGEILNRATGRHR